MPFSASKKFWETPELVENLLPFLDHKATSVLAQAHVKTRNILQGSYVWNKLIRRCCPYEEHKKDFPKDFNAVVLQVCNGVSGRLNLDICGEMGRERGGKLLQRR